MKRCIYHLFAQGLGISDESRASLCVIFPFFLLDENKYVEGSSTMCRQTLTMSNINPIGKDIKIEIVFYTMIVA